MRRLLRLLCATALGVSLLGALPAEAAEAVSLSVFGEDSLLNENGDGYWESARIHVSTDASSAHWSLTTAGGDVVAEADLTEGQLSASRPPYGTYLSVSSATTGGHPLAAGTYRFTVTGTSPYETRATASTAIYVSTAPPLSPLTPNAAVIYPNDSYAGVAHEATFRHGLDRTHIVQGGASMFEVVRDDGVAYGPWLIDPSDPVLRWDGTGSPQTGGTNGPAPAGTYRVRLLIRAGRSVQYGPLSQPFRVSAGYREFSEHTESRPANATRTATLTQRGARVRAVNGSLRYRATNTDWRREPLVRTAHRARVPRERVPGTTSFLVIRGRWQWAQDPDAEIVTPSGRVRAIDDFAALNKRFVMVSIPPRWIHPDGTVHFRLLWNSFGPTGAPHRIGRADTVGVQVSSYRWRDLG